MVAKLGWGNHDIAVNIAAGDHALSAYVGREE
jgi:hypothetical protein